MTAFDSPVARWLSPSLARLTAGKQARPIRGGGVQIDNPIRLVRVALHENRQGRFFFRSCFSLGFIQPANKRSSSPNAPSTLELHRLGPTFMNTERGARRRADGGCRRRRRARREGAVLKGRCLFDSWRLRATPSLTEVNLWPGRSLFCEFEPL